MSQYRAPRIRYHVVPHQALSSASTLVSIPSQPTPPQAHGNSNPLRLALCLSCLSSLLSPSFSKTPSSSLSPLPPRAGLSLKRFRSLAGLFSNARGPFLFFFPVSILDSAWKSWFQAFSHPEPGYLPSCFAAHPLLHHRNFCWSPFFLCDFFLDDVDDTSILFPERPIDTRSASRYRLSSHPQLSQPILASALHARPGQPTFVVYHHAETLAFGGNRHHHTPIPGLKFERMLYLKASIIRKYGKLFFCPGAFPTKLDIGRLGGC